MERITQQHQHIIFDQAQGLGVGSRKHITISRSAEFSKPGGSCVLDLERINSRAWILPDLILAKDNHCQRHNHNISLLLL
jgi:hypothetical protein